MLTFYAVADLDSGDEGETLFSNEQAAQDRAIAMINLSLESDTVPFTRENATWVHHANPEYTAPHYPGNWQGYHFADGDYYVYYRDVKVFETNEEAGELS